jgi:hypothetical protein
MRPDLGLIGVDDEVERLGIDIALLGQNGLERPHPKLHLVELGAGARAGIIVRVSVLMYGHRPH